MTRLLTTKPEDIATAVACLGDGGLVAFPTETVYGLGADARNTDAVAAIFSVKGRPSFNPLIIHVATLAAAQSIADFNDVALKLASQFWPGPLTLVLPLRADAGISPLVSAGLPTVAIRVPAHDVAQKLLAAFDGPVAAPSANPSGQLSPTTAQHVITALSGKLAAIIDGGPCNVGVESTIVGFEPEPVILRPGGITRAEITACLDHPISIGISGETPTSPGQLASHYAPNAKLRLNAHTKFDDELLLGFGPVDCDLNLSESADLTEATFNLFSHLRQLDERSQGKIAVSPIPTTGLGLAINDRLQRAAAPRP